MSDIRYQYYVEGQCEKKLIEELKRRQAVISGKVNVFNVKQKVFTNERLRTLVRNTVVILVFDTDTKELKTLRDNISILRRHKNIREIWCVMQVENLEDELKRAAQVREIKDLLGCKSDKDFKSAFIAEKNLLEKLDKKGFTFAELWTTRPPREYNDLENAGYRIKKK